MSRPRSLDALVIALTPLALTACGGGGGGGGGTSTAPANVAETLDRLGVDTTSTPRVDGSGNPLPEDYGPLGTTFELTRRTELLMGGVLNSSGNPVIRVKEDVAASSSLGSAPTLWSEAAPGWPGIQDSTPETYEARRGIVMGDVTGDGRDSVVDVRIEPTGLVLRHTNEPGGSTPNTSEFTISGPVPATSLELLAADVDGDLRDEIVVALADGVEVSIMIIDDASTVFAVDPNLTRTFPTVLAGSSASAVLAGGNLDADPGEEIVLVRNEVAGPMREARYAILDDAATGLAVIQDGPIEYDDGQVISTALAADAAVGDFDGDNIEEVLLVGPSEDPDTACGEFDYFGIAIDDGLQGYAPLGGRAITDLLNTCLQNEPISMWWIPALAIDMDGDRIDEALVGRYLFELDPEGGVVWRTVNRTVSEPLVLPDDLFFRTGAGQGTQRRHRSTMAIAAGDFDGYATGQQPDGAEELAVTFDGMREIRILPFVANGPSYSLGAPKTQNLGENNQQGGALYPTLAACDVDEDSITLVRTETEHELIFTEPIVLAAIAAPPCSTGIGQNLAFTSATIGSTISQGNASSRTVTATASATVGFKFDGGAITQSEFEATLTMRASASRSTSESYELSVTRSYTTGALEDAVVFTTLPMDRYTYRVLQHPDPALEGREIIVDLPRSPVTLIAERTFYNDAVSDPSARVGADIMTHTTGNHRSYKGLGEKNQLLAQTGGLDSPIATVGPGGQTTTTGIAVGNAISSGDSLEIGWEFQVMATTGGAVTGYSVGASTESTLSVTSGEETFYEVVVGNVDPANFAANFYSYGMFTYVHRDPVSGREFQVLDFWVQ